MDGLIPMVYKSLRRNKTRMQYTWLSSSSPSPSTHIADFYMSENDHNRVVSGGPDKVSGLHGALHRRYNSVHVEDHESAAAAKRRQLLRRAMAIVSESIGDQQSSRSCDRISDRSRRKGLEK